MKQKNRICRECGNHTSEKTCEICGRKTEIVEKASSDVTEEYVSTFDHIPQEEELNEFDHIPQEMEQNAFDHIPQKEESIEKAANDEKKIFSSIKDKKQLWDHYKNKNNFKRYEKKPESGKSSMEKFKGVAIALVVLIFIGIKVFSYFPMDENTPSEPVDDEMGDVVCTMVQDEAGNYAHLINPYPYAADGTLEDMHGRSYYEVSYLEPYSDTKIRISSDDNTCVLTNVQSYKLDMSEPDVSYQLFSKRVDTIAEVTSIDIVLNEEVDEEQLDALMRYIYAGIIAGGREDIKNVNVYQGNLDVSNQMYMAYVDQKEETIVFYVQNDYPAMPEIVIE